MKTLSLIMLLSLSLSSLSLALEPAQQRTLNKFFASKLSKTYEATFLKNLETYNQSQHTVGSVLQKHKALNKNLKLKSSLYKDEKLPTFTITDNSARASIGNNVIHFSIESLLDGAVYLNKTKFNLIEIEDLSTLKDLNIKTSEANLFIKSINLLVSEAHANDSDKFEVLIFSTLIALKDDFDSSWCMFDSCREERAKRNFEMAMHEVKLKAIQCENRDMNFNLPSDLEDYPNTQMSLSLKDKLADLFHSFPQGDLTCQRMVEEFQKDEIKRRTSRVERRGYGGVDSFTAEENREANKRDFNQYIQEICRPFVELRNCLIDRHVETQAIHDKARGNGKSGGWKSYEDQYEVGPRGQGVQR